MPKDIKLLGLVLKQIATQMIRDKLSNYCERIYGRQTECVFRSTQKICAVQNAWGMPLEAQSSQGSQPTELKRLIQSVKIYQHALTSKLKF